MSRFRVIVIGGGLAGLSAAVEALDAGLQVTLLEERPWLGGATWSLKRDGVVVDNGQHVFLRCCTAYLGFLRRLGVTEHVTLQRRLNVVVRSPLLGREARLQRYALPRPLHLMPSLLRFRPLQPAERLHAALTVRRMGTLDLADRRLDYVSCGDWLAAQGETDRALDCFWDLIVRATLNAPVRSASLWLAAKVFQTGLLADPEASDLGWANIPLGNLHAAPALRILEAGGARVLTRCKATYIAACAGGRFCVKTLGGSFVGDAVIVSTPHEPAADLLPPAAGVPGEQLRALRTSPILNLHVFFDRRVSAHPVVAAVDSPLQWVFDRTESVGVRQGQYLVFSLSAADDLVTRSTAELRGRLLPEIAALLPGARSARVLQFLVTREPAATFLQGPGTLRLRPGSRTRIPGLYLAGAWTNTGWPASMEGAVRSGQRAARAVLEDLQQRKGARDGNHCVLPFIRPLALEAS